MRETEKGFASGVIQLARMSGHLCYHTYDSRRSAAGFPDLVIVKAGKPAIFAELKTQTGTRTPAQIEWGDELLATPGSEYKLWRPASWPEIQEALMRSR